MDQDVRERAERGQPRAQGAAVREQSRSNSRRSDAGTGQRLGRGSARRQCCALNEMPGSLAFVLVTVSTPNENGIGVGVSEIVAQANETLAKER